MHSNCGNRSYCRSYHVCDKENCKEIITLDLFEMSLRKLRLYSFRVKNTAYSEKIVIFIGGDYCDLICNFGINISDINCCGGCGN